MRVLILGGSGFVGSAVLKRLVQQGCDVYALSRTANTATQMHNAGATPITGDIRQPEGWIDCVQNVDAVVHAAATWTQDMGFVDQTVVTALLKALRTADGSKALIYTGGCWLYGNTGNVIATESAPLNPLASDRSTVGLIEKVLSDSYVRGVVIHPAMVYARAGGVFERMYDDIDEYGYVRVFGSARVRWPLIHRDDLAQLYSLVLLHAHAGDVFNASAIDGVAIGDIATAISVSTQSDSAPMVFTISHATSEFGDWAEGYGLDQQMSGQKARIELNWMPEHVDVFSDIH